MLDFHELINFIARILLVSYFIKAGISNALHPAPVIDLIKSKKFPLPYLVFVMVLIIQIIGGLSVIFKFYPLFGALSLAGFTVLSNLFFLNFWKMDKKQGMMVKHLFFANIAVIGGLLLAI